MVNSLESCGWGKREDRVVTGTLASAFSMTTFCCSGSPCAGLNRNGMKHAADLFIIQPNGGFGSSTCAPWWRGLDGSKIRFPGKLIGFEIQQKIHVALADHLIFVSPNVPSTSIAFRNINSRVASFFFQFTSGPSISGVFPSTASNRPAGHSFSGSLRPLKKTAKNPPPFFAS